MRISSSVFTILHRYRTIPWLSTDSSVGDKIRSEGDRPSTPAYVITLTTALPRKTLKSKLGRDVLNSRRIMRGYHIRIRVTVRSTSSGTKTPTTTAKTGTPARAAWTTDAYIPKSIFESLPSHTPKKTTRNNAILGSRRRDYRYGPIRIDWLDLGSSSHPSSSISKEPKRGIKSGKMNNQLTTSASGNGKERDLRGRGEPSDLGSRFCGAHVPFRRPNRGQVCT